MRLIKILCATLWGLLLWGCSDDTPASPAPEKPVIEKTVAVVLPMEKGLGDHWRRSLALYSASLDRAYKSQSVSVRLNFEFYDELTEDLPRLASVLGSREDVYAVVGGLYSADAAQLTSGLTRVGKTFLTLATSEELVRAYASTGYLWAMTETDITQCEVLLAKVESYGAASVALVAKEDDIYGKTFLDWFAFQARELGLDNRGVYPYGSSGPSQAVAAAVASGADYVVCVPSEIEEIGPMLEAAPSGPGSPRLIFSDTAYGTDVVTLYGQRAEGLEGVAFGSDPESGFDVSYRTFFGLAPTTGEAQLYDAVMLLGYAAWMQHLHPDLTLREALRELVSGEDINMGSWTGEDMSLVVDALARGDSPRVRGASGQLLFDSRIFTNVLATTYYSYRIYGGQYIILDYNTSDGGNRTDATLAGWNWKASQMQEFDDGAAVSYGPHTGNKALLVAASSGWENYRHQADVTAIYRLLKANGFSDDDIMLIAEDDLARNPSNPEPGVIRLYPGGDNVYEDIRIDYRLSALSPTDLVDILLGDRNDRLPAVVDAGPGDNIFIFWSGHGVPGAMCWGDDPYGMPPEILGRALDALATRGSFRKLLMMTEACYSGGVAEKLTGVPGMLFITAANGEETSKADIFNGDLRIWMSNRFTSTLIEQLTANPRITMRELYYRLFINTLGSHVTVYNAPLFGNLYTTAMDEFVVGL